MKVLKIKSSCLIIHQEKESLVSGLIFMILKRNFIKDLFNEKILTDEDTHYVFKVCKGYEYIKSFRRFYKKNGYLTPKQLSQLKRLAYEIAYWIYCKN